MTSTEIEIRKDHQPSLLEQKGQYATWLAKADLLPAAYRGKPANVLLAIEYGEALGVAPMTAINMIHVIEGKPTISAGLMAALVRQAGHRLRIAVSAEPLAATAELYRCDDPEFAFTSTWTMERATAAGLTSKSNWKHYPANMLKARAISEVCRDACPEVLAGIAYTPDEIGEGFLTDVERDDMGLMSRAEATAHEVLTVLPGSKPAVRVTPQDVAEGDPEGQLFEVPGG